MNPVFVCNWEVFCLHVSKKCLCLSFESYFKGIAQLLEELRLYLTSSDVYNTICENSGIFYMYMKILF